MKHFDENGNFVDTPKTEEMDEEIRPFSINYVYDFIPNKEDELN